MKALSLTVCCITLLTVRAAFSSEPPPLTRIAQVRALSRQQAAKAIRLRVRGVVTWQNGQNSWFVIQDNSAGLGVDISLGRVLKIWQGGDDVLKQIRVGTSLEIEGVSHAAGFAPLIVPGTIRILGQESLPAARPMSAARFFSGADACERVEVRGVVQGFQPWHGGWALLVNANPGRLSADVPKYIVPEPQALVDAEVCLRGVAATGFNSRGELTAIRLLISQAEDVMVEKPAPRTPFDGELTALNQLMPFSDPPTGPHRKLVEGTVVYAENGRMFYIQDAGASVRVETLAPEDLKLGDRVRVAGFVDMRRDVAGLVGAVARKVGTASLPQPQSVSPEEIMALNTRAELSGLPAKPSDYDGQLITFRARLIDMQQTAGRDSASQELSLEAGQMLVEAMLRQGDAAAFKGLQIGSVLQVTGVVQLDYSQRLDAVSYHSRPPSGISLLLRSARDVAVVQVPPWWTPRRLFGLLALGMVLMAVVLLWIWQLRRQLQAKTQQLAAEMHARRDAAIEFKATIRERTRLAANLHDTLLQSISALNYQLEACETESLPRPERKANYLASARRIVQHAQQDLRGTVWALRALPLDERPFAEALRALANQLAENRGVNINITADDRLPTVSDFVAGNLLLVAQEAMHNALKHANPSRIDTSVSMTPDGEHIEISIRDDGAGFDLNETLHAKAGHFGLEGMRERAERLGGKLKIESRPGIGTTVHVAVLLNSFDEELA